MLVLLMRLAHIKNLLFLERVYDLKRKRFKICHKNIEFIEFFSSLHQLFAQRMALLHGTRQPLPPLTSSKTEPAFGQCQLLDFAQQAL